MAGHGSGRGVSSSSSGETQRNSLSRKKKAKSSKDTVHCVCSSIEDSGHMVECETCSCWSHCKCVGLSSAVAPSFPFVCPYCVRSLFARLDSLSTEISALRAQVSTVTLPSSTHDSLPSEVQRIDESLTQLPAAVESLQARSDSDSSVPPECPNPDAPNGESPSGRVSLSTSPPLVPSPSTNTADSRFNIVISGIAELPKGTPRLARISSDASAVMDVLSEVSLDGHPPIFARDCRRLGRYRQNSSKPRPLLITLNSTFGVSNVLSKCHRLTSRVSIRPDLSFTERKERGLYLHERRKLIDTGVDKSCIKIKKSGLYVSGKLAGRVTNEVFHSHVSLGALAPQLCHDTAQPPSSPPPCPASTTTTNGSVSESLSASSESVSDSSSPSSEAAPVP